MRKEIPCGTVRAVVLTHRAPLAFREIRSPALPVHFALAGLFEAFFFSIHRWSPVLSWNSKTSACEPTTPVALCDLDLFQPLPRGMRMLHLMKSQLAVPDYRGNGIGELVNQIPAKLLALSL